MKCNSCNCMVSSDFVHALTTNSCPKCGKSIMEERTRILWTELNEFMSIPTNDLGDLAVYLVSKSQIEDPKKVEEVLPEQKLQTEPLVELPKKVEKKKEKILPPASTETGEQLLPNERRDIFNKRSGVDFKKIVKQIQSRTEESALPVPVEPDEGDFESESYSDIDTPLSPVEIGKVSNLFNSPASLEIEEFKRLERAQQLSETGSVGKIKRTS